MADALVSIIDNRAHVEVGGAALLAPMLETAAGSRDDAEAASVAAASHADDAAARATLASGYAAAAAALANPAETFAAGLALYPAGTLFSVVQPTGWIAVYKAGTSPDAAHPLIRLPGDGAYADSYHLTVSGAKSDDNETRFLDTITIADGQIFVEQSRSLKSYNWGRNYTIANGALCLVMADPNVSYFVRASGRYHFGGQSNV